ncbi:MAG: copper-binding protein [Bradyrhizobium sp.]
MRPISSIAASAALALFSSAALAEQGTVTQIDRTTNTIAIQQPQDGTVGAGGGGAVGKQFKVQPAGSLEALHAGDKVEFTVTQSGGIDTITRIEKKK